MPKYRELVLSLRIISEMLLIERRTAGKINEVLQSISSMLGDYYLR